jgi:hypothetical protein
VSARRRIVRVQDLLGRRVRTSDGRMVGRIEEMVAQRRTNGDHEVVEYHLGTGALLERLAIARRVLGRRPQMLIARWDQIDIRRPDAPVLTCGVEELQHDR